jgi:predicted transcriptional regulator
MTKLLLLSVKPRFARAMLEGRKTIEVRRKFPEVPAGTVIVLYSSSPERAVLGTVRLKQITRVDPGRVWGMYADEIALDHAALVDYLDGALETALLEVEAPETWTRPVTLSTLRELLGVEPPQSYRYLAVEQMEKIRTN